MTQKEEGKKLQGNRSYYAGRQFRKILHQYRFIAVFLLVLVILFSMLLNGKNKKVAAEPENSVASAEETSSTETILPQEEKATIPEKTETKDTEQNEMKAVWVPFMTLDMQEDPGEKAFRKKFKEIVTVAAEKKMTALIVQVRPFGDALYESALFPWSHVLTGTQGKDPGYDPLAIMIDLAHKEGLELHAWVNPLRVQINGTPEKLAKTNPYTVWKKEKEKTDWTVKMDAGIYLNPAYSGVRDYIAQGIAEIVENYEVDGVQIDDYFYPTQEASFDKTAYDAYCETTGEAGEPVSLTEWRQTNISVLVSTIYQKIKAISPETIFGVSPQGNIQNCLQAGADIYEWGASAGYADYLCPQMYVSLENEALPFQSTLEEWRHIVKNEGMKLYVGLAVYKAGSDLDDGTWEKENDILSQQVLLSRETDCDGFMFYSWEYLETDQTQEEVENVMKVLD